MELSLSAEEFESALAELLAEHEGRTLRTLQRLVPSVAKGILRRILKVAPEQLHDRRSEVEGFERRLRQRWTRGLDNLELLYSIALEVGNEFVSDRNKPRRRGSELTSRVDASLFTALMHLHIRACRTTSEILALLRTGHADGANARWRTLHELAVVSLFISERGAEVAERYLAHAAVERDKAMRQFQEHCAVLGYRRFDKRTVRRVAETKERMVVKHGEEMRDEYGWAAKTLNQRRVNFAEIERSLDMTMWRPFYKMASDGIHAGSRLLGYSLGDLSDGKNLVAGASNAGLLDPARSTAISLVQVTVAFLMLAPNLDRLVGCSVLSLLMSAVEREFREAEMKLMRDERR